jgi:hypothetical protein
MENNGKTPVSKVHKYNYMLLTKLKDVAAPKNTQTKFVGIKRD